MNILYFKRIDDRAKLPTRANRGDVGLDVAALEPVDLIPGRVTRVRTGLALSYDTPTFIDASTFLKIEGRSGLASNGIFPVGGIVDPTYRGEIIVLLYNSTDDTVHVHQGMKCAQLVAYVAVSGGMTVVESKKQDTTARGTSGFGSTDKTKVPSL